MKSPDILCFGEPLVEFNQLPDGNFKMGFGGDVSNVAISASRAGGNSGLITHVGDDLFGIELRKLWDRESVDQVGVKTIQDTETGVYFVTHDDDGHHFHYRRRNSAASLFEAPAVPLELITQSQIFYSSGISLAIGASSKEACMVAMRTAKDAGIQCAFDPNLRLALWSLDHARHATHEAMKYCDIALPGFDDAKLLTGRANPEDILSFYHDLGAQIVVLTLGKDGAIISFEGKIQTIKPHTVRAVDATGAGDCFNGVFLAEVLRTGDPLMAAMSANEAAAKSTTRFGAV